MKIWYYWVLSLSSVISVTWEAEIWRFVVQVQPEQKVKNTSRQVSWLWCFMSVVPATWEAIDKTTAV
jgi:hypothetical protein